MKVKKYVGETIQDTIFKVKADLGSDAIIIDTRRCKKGGFLGLFGKKYVEVLAALEEKQNNGETVKEINDLKLMINNLNNNIIRDNLTHDVVEDDKFIPVYKHLLQQGVKKNYCSKIIREIKKEPEEVERAVRSYLLKLLGKASPLSVNSRQKVISFVGPTGTGKTTTIAKIAAKFALEEEKKVGLITADTFRIAAVQQLQTYSNIVDIPLKVVYDGENIAEFIKKKYNNLDLILIDTPGSNWKDKIQIGRLKEFVADKIIDEIHLVLSLNTKSRDLYSIVDNFSRLKPDKFLFTKLDETSTYGDIVNLRLKYNMPISYITFGQNVPEDIKTAENKQVLNYIMGDNNE